jgi:hypothetical protein
MFPPATCRTRSPSFDVAAPGEAGRTVDTLEAVEGGHRGAAGGFKSGDFRVGSDSVLEEPILGDFDSTN